MFKLKKIALACAALIAAAGIAYAGGAFQGYPVIGGAGTNCLSFGNNAVCNQFELAGPTDLVGTATIPADTNVQSAGNVGNPATVGVPAVLTGATVSGTNAPLTGASITLPVGTAKLMLQPAGTIATLTVVLPAAASLFDGEEMFIYSTQTVTALTVTPGSGTTITPSITTVTAAAPVKLVYSK